MVTSFQCQSFNTTKNVAKWKIQHLENQCHNLIAELFFSFSKNHPKTLKTFIHSCITKVMHEWMKLVKLTLNWTPESSSTVLLHSERGPLMSYWFCTLNRHSSVCERSVKWLDLYSVQVVQRYFCLFLQFVILNNIINRRCIHTVYVFTMHTEKRESYSWTQGCIDAYLSMNEKTFFNDLFMEILTAVTVKNSGNS